VNGSTSSTAAPPRQWTAARARARARATAVARQRRYVRARGPCAALLRRGRAHRAGTRALRVLTLRANSEFTLITLHLYTFTLIFLCAGPAQGELDDAMGTLQRRLALAEGRGDGGLNPAPPPRPAPRPSPPAPKSAPPCRARRAPWVNDAAAALGARARAAAAAHGAAAARAGARFTSHPRHISLSSSVFTLSSLRIYPVFTPH
jgi:hypothetical protein